MIHIADAPCHGKKYHGVVTSDRYPEGDPGGRQLDDLMHMMAKQNIFYYFGYIKKACTLPMIKAFNSSLREASSDMHSIQQFDAQVPDHFLSRAYKSVTYSVSVTLDVLMNDGKRSRRNYTLDKSIPNWETLESQMVLITKPPTAGSAAQLTVPSNLMCIKVARNPFAEGNQKIVYHAYDEDNRKHIVLKQSKWDDARSNSLKRQIETAQTQRSLPSSVQNLIERDQMKHAKYSLHQLESWH